MREYLTALVSITPLGGFLKNAPRARGRKVVCAAFLTFIFATAALWPTLAFPGSLPQRAIVPSPWFGDTRPNLILITIDTLRADHLGVYGSTAGLTPQLDAFARQATRYDAVYANSSWTVPSFAALFTGQPPFQSLEKYNLKAQVPLLSERLQNVGYWTAAEITNPFLSSKMGWNRGFDSFRNGSLITEPIPLPTTGEHVTARASEWIRMNPREPFFFWVHYFDPHLSYNSPDTPTALRDKYPSEWKAGRQAWYAKMQHEAEPVRKKYQEFCRAMYAEEVRYVDRWVGELLKQIQAAGLFDKSLIIISADHGEELFDHGAFEHGHSMHKSVLHVPLLVKWPRGRVEADAHIMQTVSLADVHAECLRIAGLKEGVKGRGLPRRDGLKGTQVFSEWMLYGNEQTALTTDTYKLIYWPQTPRKKASIEVYDLRTDREERNDLAASPVAEELRSELLRYTQTALEARRLTASQNRAKKPRPELSEKAKRKLRDLGYLGK